MSKCNKCKYEYLSKIEEPCKYCREKCGVVTLGYQMSEDKFVPKEEQPTTEYKGCDGCYYEWLGESDAPCCECKHRFEPGTMARLKAKDCFKPKEEKVDENRWSIEGCRNGIVIKLADLSSFSLWKVEPLIAITEHLGFTIEQVYSAYCEKNKINYQRLKEGY